MLDLKLETIPNVEKPISAETGRNLAFLQLVEFIVHSLIDENQMGNATSADGVEVLRLLHKMRMRETKKAISGATSA